MNIEKIIIDSFINTSVEQNSDDICDCCIKKCAKLAADTIKEELNKGLTKSIFADDEQIIDDHITWNLISHSTILKLEKQIPGKDYIIDWIDARGQTMSKHAKTLKEAFLQIQDHNDYLALEKCL
jgi:hypothetical protein